MSHVECVEYSHFISMERLTCAKDSMAGLSLMNKQDPLSGALFYLSIVVADRMKVLYYGMAIWYRRLGKVLSTAERNQR